MTRIGIFGGSFDPVHYGHLILAETAREQLQLDRVLLVPAAQSPLKERGPVASNQARLEMLQLAIGGTPGMEVEDWELKQGGTSFTIDTLRYLANREPQAKLFLVVGADQLPMLSAWKSPEEISNLATWTFVKRAGFPPLDFSLLAPYATPAQFVDAQASTLVMPAMELSSTELRTRAAEHRSLRFRLPRAIEEYIRTNNLYHE